MRGSLTLHCCTGCLGKPPTLMSQTAKSAFSRAILRDRETVPKTIDSSEEIVGISSSCRCLWPAGHALTAPTASHDSALLLDAAGGGRGQGTCLAGFQLRR